MAPLSERDVRLALELAYDAASLTGRDAFPRDVLERLARLIPADAIVGYHEVVVGTPCRVVEFDGTVAGRTCRMVEQTEIPLEGIPPHIQEAGGAYLRQDPLRHGLWRSETHPMKLSDFLTRRQRRKLDMYWHVWKPLGIDDSLRVWLPAPAGRARVLYLERGQRDFTERDRALLEVLRPTLIRIQAAAYARRRATPVAARTLTNREQEVLGWIARGRTSREIAAILVVSPYTVEKHVEHILDKLDVRTRSAAVARAFGEHALSV